MNLLSSEHTMLQNKKINNPVDPFKFHLGKKFIFAVKLFSKFDINKFSSVILL